MNEREIFAEAMQQPTAAEQAAFLQRVCGADGALRQRIEVLIGEQDQLGSFLESPPTAVVESTDQLRTIAQESPSLAFLSPSSRVDSLGRLGHYEILEVVGSGGMGVVLKAFDEQLQRIVAIKAMALSLAASATSRQRFVREAQAAAAVNHDNVVDIYSVEEVGPVPYLAMEYVSGISLEDKLQQAGPLELKEILRIGLQTADGLAAAHRQGLVHRDVKPANILLENGVGRVKITDFGLARAAADVSVTQTGVIAGTPAYMSPEQARGEAVDHRSDLFSLGSVLYALCAGRTPFRSSTAPGVLKQVCDEQPHSIRDLNPDIPEWLCAVIDKLHAKAPAERFQSAAELAEVLGRYLAHVQQPSLPLPTAIVPVAAPQKPHTPNTAHKSRHDRRRWVVAAVAALVVLALTVTLTDASGITHVAATVIRIFTPDGVLIVKTDDPGVKVTVEGDGGLVITGAGAQEVRLKPGSYKVQATKDGNPVPLDRELVTISQGGKELVNVRLESAAPATAKVEENAFVILGNQGVAVRKFSTLAEAVLGASDGDTIEIRGNGPFVTDPIKIKSALTIRAGEGFRPVIKLGPEALQQDDDLLTTNAALVLEGLELHRAQWERGRQGIRLAVNADAAPLRAANCRFGAPVHAYHSDMLEFRNCEFLSAEGYGVGGWLHSGSQFIFENCLHRTGAFAIGFSFDDAALKGTSIQIQRNTFVMRKPLLAWVCNSQMPGRLDPPQNSAPIGIEVSESVFDVPGVIGVEQAREFLEKAAELAPADAERALLRLIQWRGERNLFATASTSVTWSADWQPLASHGPKSLEEWKQFWGGSDSDSLEGRITFQVGNLVTRTAADLDRLTPDDFRLRADSAGYRAGKDGKDLGADVDLVGPGPAYERWKETPEYQEWLMETGQKK